jgi:RNA polymerase sigma-70 factor, ECF subfamily
MEAPTDRELMGRLAGGDREALAPLVSRHYQRLYRIALSYLRNADDALDAVQETFVKACEKAGTWREVSEVAPWLTRIAINESIDRYRRARRRLDREEALDEGDHDSRLTGEELPPDRRLLGRELGERIGAALDGLPTTQRAVFVLRHYEEMSLEEIAESLTLSLGTVKSSLHRALRRLRPRLQELVR